MEQLIDVADMDSFIDDSVKDDGALTPTETVSSMEEQIIGTSADVEECPSDLDIANDLILDIEGLSELPPKVADGTGDAQAIADVLTNGNVVEEDTLTGDDVDGDNAQPTSQLDASLEEAPRLGAALDGMFVPFKHEPPKPDFKYTPNAEWRPLDFTNISPSKWAEVSAKYRNTPMGYDTNGIPIYSNESFGVEFGSVPGCDGEFIVAVKHILPSGFHSIEWKRIPEAGEGRDAVLAELKSQFLEEMELMERQRDFENTMRDIRMQAREIQHQNDMDQLELERKDQELRNEIAELERAHIWNMTPDQYRTVSEMGVSRVDPLQPYSDLFKDASGRIYRVSVDGTVTKKF